MGRQAIFPQLLDLSFAHAEVEKHAVALTSRDLCRFVCTAVVLHEHGVVRFLSRRARLYCDPIIH
jgi:hypothetical protein